MRILFDECLPRRLKILRAKSIRYEDLAPLALAIADALEAIKPGAMVRVG